MQKAILQTIVTHHRILLVLLVGFSFVTFTSPRPFVESSEAAPVITRSTDSPEERLPQQAGYTWRGRADDPKRIVIPAIGVDALIQNVGVDQNRQVAVPNNIHIAGWFVDSVRPGKQGLSIVDGHVNGRNSDAGVFKNLDKLREGDSVEIIFGDDSRQRFTVRKSYTVDLEQAASRLFSQIPDIDRQLNLITCVGSYDEASRTYTDRHIVSLAAL